MKILHFADAHANKDFNKFKQSLDIIKGFVKDIDFIVFSGDLFDSRIYAQTLYTNIIDEFADLANIRPVFMVYGTPSHDAPGSLDMLKNIDTKYPITIVDRIDKNDFWGYKDDKFMPNIHGDIDIIAFPWIMQSRLLTDDEMANMGVMERKELEEKRLKEWVDEKDEFYMTSKVPVILVGHAQLIDSVYSVGQDISPTYQDPNWFYHICDIGMFGHIHLQHNNMNLWYSGSIYNKNWGEMEEKAFLVHDIKKGSEIKTTVIKLGTPKRVKVECDTYEDYINFKKDNDFKNGEYEMWLTIYVSNRQQIDEEAEQEFWKDRVVSLRLDVKMLSIESIKREKVELTQNMTVVDKFKRWCEINDLIYNDFHIEKIKELI